MVLKVLLLCGSVSLFVASKSVALPPPESQGMTPSDNAVEMDAELEKWLAGLSIKASGTGKEVTDYILQLRGAKGSSAVLRKLVRDSYDSFVNMTNARKHVLYIYFADELLAKSEYLSPSQIANLKSLIAEDGAHSCPQKESVLENIEELGGKIPNMSTAKKILADITAFRSSLFLKKALGGYADALPRKLRSGVADDLRLAAAPYESILDDHSWLREGMGIDSRGKNGVFRKIDLAHTALRRRRCTTARNYLVKAARLDIRRAYFDKVKKLTSRIDRCYKRRGSKARIGFWKGVEGSLGKAYGFQGEGFAQLKRGALYWGKDRFPEAIRIHKHVFAKAQQFRLRETQAQSLYTLARIYKNQGKFRQALKHYERFAKEFSQHEYFLEASKSIVLIATHLGDIDRAIKFNNRIIEKQSVLAMDQRSTAALSFALFWGGRIYFNKGNRIRAYELWTRGASEYYSSYYGALSHYVLEKAQGKKLALQPSRRKPFSIDSLVAGFSREEKVLVSRIRHLIGIGFKTEAACEITELSRDDTNNKAQLLKSMLLYTSGEWLEAIRTYGKLPRTFRHSLVDGMERILFPRAYADTVNKHSKTLGVDPELIFSIIRQESVFNPKAKSPVGARGLMQLMPQTAKLEAKRLQRGFVTRKQRRAIIRKTRVNRNSLFDAEMNLTLGIHHVKSLMKRYGNPVFILTSYNASPSATKRWRKNLVSDDMLFFIERIPYQETQGYVKLVMRNYFYYKRWYEGDRKDLRLLDGLLPDNLRLAKPLPSKKASRKI